MTKTSLKPRRVLIADDDEKILSLLVELLEQEGYEVLCASDGGTALELALCNDLDVVVSDVVMPVLDGIEATRLIKAIEATRAARVIAYTGNPSSDTDSTSNLFAAVLQKPATPYAVLATVKQLVAQ